MAAKDNKDNKAGKGAQASNAPKIPTTSAPQGGEQPRISPAAVTPKVGMALSSLKRIPGIVGLARKGGGGRTSNGEKPKLLAVFFVVYAKWTEHARFIPNGMVSNVFGEGLTHTKENRQMLIVGSDGNVAAICLFKEVPAWLKANCDGFKSVIGENGTYTMPAGMALAPDLVYDEKNSTKLASFRKNADLAEHYAKLATTAEGDEKAEYEQLAAYFGGADVDKYDGFACATPENAQKLADIVRAFHAMNPEVRNEFTELENWTPVFGQKDMATIANAHWPNTAEAKAEAAEAEKAGASA